jgi:signal transduction histidine kinase
MRERALLVGGELDLTSDAAGGTEVRLTVPVPQTESELWDR